MTDPEADHVECYSGHTYAQEPRALVWQGGRYQVAQIEGRWRTPEGPAFRVTASPEEVFELYYHELEDRWTIRAMSKKSKNSRHNRGVRKNPAAWCRTPD